MTVSQTEHYIQSVTVTFVSFGLVKTQQRAMSDRITFVAALALLLFVVIIGAQETTVDCPNFVPSVDDTSTIAGNWFYTETVVVGIPVPKRKCWIKSFKVNNRGTITSQQMLEDTESDIVVNFTTAGSPVDHVRARVSFLSSLYPDNANIYTFMKIVPENYFIQGVCMTVKGILGYQIDVVSKETQLDDETLNDIKAFLAESNLDNNLIPINQTHCSSVYTDTL